MVSQSVGERLVTYNIYERQVKVMVLEVLHPDIKEEIKKDVHDAYISGIEEGKRDALVTKEWLTPNEVKEMLKLSTNTLNNWISKGLPVAVVESKRYIRRQEINQFLEKHQ